MCNSLNDLVLENFANTIENGYYDFHAQSDQEVAEEMIEHGAVPEDIALDEVVAAVRQCRDNDPFLDKRS